MAELTKLGNPDVREGFLAAPLYVDSRVLSAAAQETITVPTGAHLALFKATGDFYAKYFTTAESGDAVTNGAFAADTGWTKGTGWTIAAGVATSDASQAGNSDLSQTNTTKIIAGRSYSVVFTVTAYTAGNVRAVIGGGTAGTNRASAATFTETLIAGSDGTIILRADLDFAGSIDNFSVTPIAVTAIDQTNGEAAELNPAQRNVDGIATVSLISAGTPTITVAWFA